MVGQNFPFLKCSPAVFCLHGLPQCRQVVEVALIRRFVVKRRVRSLLVGERDVLLSSALGLAHAVVGMQIDLFVFDTLPEPFHEDVITPAAGAIHADGHAVLLQQSGELAAGELAPLVGVEDGRYARTGDRLLDGVQAEIGGQRIGAATTTSGGLTSPSRRTETGRHVASECT